MNNGVGYAAPTSRGNRVVLGTDGIGADMLEEARLAYVALRANDVTATPDTVWSWLDEGYRFFPDARLNVAEVILHGRGADDEAIMLSGCDERGPGSSR